MTGWTFLCAVLTFCALLIMDGCPARAEPVTCAEPTATDGDSIRCQDGTRIRLAGIDAPEKFQPFGWEAHQWLAAAIMERASIRCRGLYDEDGASGGGDPLLKARARSTDRYGRLIAICYSGSVDLGAWLVRNGRAWDYVAYSRGRYADEQEQAKADRLGIWQDANPIPPWDWRRGQR